MKYEAPVMIIKKFEAEEFVVASGASVTSGNDSATTTTFDLDNAPDTIMF